MVGLLVSQQLDQTATSGSIFWQIMYSLFMFGVVVFLAIIVTRLWVKKGAGIATGPKQHLRLLEHLPLGAGKGLCLVKALDSVLLVSITDKAITVLQEVPMSPEFELPPTTANAITLPGWLTKMLTQGKAIVGVAEQGAPPVQSNQGFAHELRERLRQLKEPRT